MLVREGKEEPTDIEAEVGAEATLHHLSLHALTTIRFQGSILGTQVQILLDGGSLDTFIHPRIVYHLSLPIERTTELRVLGGTERILTSSELVRHVPVQVNVYTITLTLFVLPIAAIDIVIGADWLETLGAHVADYSTSTLKLYQDNQFIILKGFRG